MAFIHIPSQDSFGKRFGNALIPQINRGIERYAEEEGEKRKARAKSLLEEKKDQREQERLKANTKALLGDEYQEELALEPTTLAAVYKEKQKNARQQRITDIIQKGSESTSNVGDGEKSEPTNQRKEFNPSNLSDQDIIEIGSIDPQQGKFFLDAKANQQKNDLEKEKNLRDKFESNREFEWKRAGDILKNVDTLRDNLPEKRTAVNQLKAGFSKGDTSKWKSWAADALGIEPLRDADDALAKSLVKDFFITNLSKAGARPNQFLEQQISDALVKLGRDPEANELVAELMDYWVTREEEKVRTIDILEDEDLANEGYIKGNIGKRAAQSMKNWETQERDKFSYNIQKKKESYHPEDLEIITTVSPGTPLTLEKARVFKRRYGKDAEKAAKNAGYDLDIYARVIG